jgi:uncharacterized protein YndB with AHSA1/START domain
MTPDTPSSAPQHGTLVLRGSFEVPAERLYAAVSDPLERALVGTLGGDHVMLIDESDFRVGGRDFYRFGLKGAPAFRAEAIFHRIVPRSLIVATEIVHSGGICISIELVTLVLSEQGTASDLKLTAQVLSLCADEDLADAASARHQAFIEALGRHLGTANRDGQRPFSRR